MILTFLLWAIFAALAAYSAVSLFILCLCVYLRLTGDKVPFYLVIHWPFLLFAFIQKD